MAITACLALIFTAAPAAAAPPSVAAPAGPYLLAGSGTVVFYESDHTRRDCTLGFVAAGLDGYARALTAGHCGDLGQAIYASDGDRIGVIDYADTPSDIAQIRVQTQRRVLSDIDGAGRVSRAMGIAEINRTQPVLCKTGQTTGLTCGRLAAPATEHEIVFDGGARPGDSGGPVWAVLPDGQLAAVGVVSAYYDDGSNNVSAVPIAPWLERWQLSLS